MFGLTVLEIGVVLLVLGLVYFFRNTKAGKKVLDKTDIDERIAAAIKDALTGSTATENDSPDQLVERLAGLSAAFKKIRESTTNEEALTTIDLLQEQIIVEVSKRS